ncbi:MAG: hypothetical protein Q9162_001574 [Coniocarpon cinnabarinum]
MVWHELAPTPPHLTYFTLSVFLIIYSLFSHFIRNRLHLSEPPLALLVGVIIGPVGLNAVDPRAWAGKDTFIQEFTRLILGLQVFVVGIELPRHYFPRHWKSVAWMLGPVMTFGWLVSAGLITLILKIDFVTALTIAACLTPTDPVLAASVLSNSRFSSRVPKRIKHLLSCESGCNDGVSFPFLYVGLSILTSATASGAVKEWVFESVLYECVVGSLVGGTIGLAANRALRFAHGRQLIDRSSFVVFYLLLAVLSVGIASTLGLDDFLVAFGAGVGFAHDGFFAARTRESKLNNVLDLLLNSTFFVFLGTVLPWSGFSLREITLTLTPGRLTALLALILVFRRIPATLAFKRFIPDIRTYREALFCGHFGPMGVGGIFLALEGRAQLENGTSIPEDTPDKLRLPVETRSKVELMWAVVLFIVMGSTLVHGFSVVVISMYSHFSRAGKERARQVGGETQPLQGMVHVDSEGEETQSEEEEEEESDGDEESGERRGGGQIRLDE